MKDRASTAAAPTANAGNTAGAGAGRALRRRRASCRTSRRASRAASFPPVSGIVPPSRSPPARPSRGSESGHSAPGDNQPSQSSADRFETAASTGIGSIGSAAPVPCVRLPLVVRCPAIGHHHAGHRFPPPACHKATDWYGAIAATSFAIRSVTVGPLLQILQRQKTLQPRVDCGRNDGRGVAPTQSCPVTLQDGGAVGIDNKKHAPDSPFLKADLLKGGQQFPNHP